MEGPRRSSLFTNPVAGVILGDPFVLRHRGRFYLYGTNDGPPLPDGRAIPVYRSDDLIHWEPLGGSLEAQDPTAEHWAPEVLAWNGRFFMVVSFGDVERRGHELWVAVADRPEGPFRLRARISDPSERFSIDGAWLLDDDGRLYLFRCLDFIAEDDPPHGTGIVVQPMRDPLTPSGRPSIVLRAHAPWQLFEADRTMPLYGGRRFAEWTTIEGPAPVRRHGRYYCGYSGGNFAGDYGTGEAVADAALGPYRDLRGREGPIFGTMPGLVEGPGHFSVVRPDLVHDWIVLHGRRPGEPGRRVWLCPACWDDSGVIIGALTDRPQPAPPLPTALCRFDGPPGSIPDGWRIESGVWRLDGDGLRHERSQGHANSYAWREGLDLAGDWAVEVYLRFPEEHRTEAGVQIGPDPGSFSVVIEAVPGGDILVNGADGTTTVSPLPTLGGEPFDLSAYHAIAIRARAGRAEVRVDGVVVAGGIVPPAGPSRLGLYAHGPAVFGASTTTLVD
jgi:arabinan endo-1,5-alpha-L-arabinosidase